MQATLQLNLYDALSPAELRELLAAAQAEQKPVERILFEAAREFCARRTATPPPAPTPEHERPAA